MARFDCSHSIVYDCTVSASLVFSSSSTCPKPSDQIFQCPLCQLSFSVDTEIHCFIRHVLSVHRWQRAEMGCPGLCFRVFCQDCQEIFYPIAHGFSDLIHHFNRNLCKGRKICRFCRCRLPPSRMRHRCWATRVVLSSLIRGKWDFAPALRPMGTKPSEEQCVDQLRTILGPTFRDLDVVALAKQPLDKVCLFGLAARIAADYLELDMASKSTPPTPPSLLEKVSVPRFKSEPSFSALDLLSPGTRIKNFLRDAKRSSNQKKVPFGELRLLADLSHDPSVFKERRVFGSAVKDLINSDDDSESDSDSDSDSDLELDSMLALLSEFKKSEKSDSSEEGVSDPKQKETPLSHSEKNKKSNSSEKRASGPKQKETRSNSPEKNLSTKRGRHSNPAEEESDPKAKKLKNMTVVSNDSMIVKKQDWLGLMQKMAFLESQMLNLKQGAKSSKSKPKESPKQMASVISKPKESVVHRCPVPENPRTAMERERLLNKGKKK